MVVMKLDSLIRNLEEINTCNIFEVEEEMLYSSNFLKENTSLSNYEEFRAKFKIEKDLLISNLGDEFKDKIIKSISNFNNWQEFYEKALSNFSVNKILKD
jgi:hypothetical protein